MERLFRMPGAVDLHVHLRDLEESYKETVATATAAARKGGVRYLLAMPNTKPRLDGAETIRRYQKIINQDSTVPVRLAGAISKDLLGRELADLEAYPALGIRWITDDGFDVNDQALLKEAYTKAARLGLTVMTHPEMDSIGAGGVINEGEVSGRLELPGQPNAKEYKAVERGLRLCRQTGARTHMTHVTTRESVELIRKAKQEGLPVTADATPHHLALTEEAVLKHGSQAKVNPPLRTEADRRAVIEGLRDGTIDCIATDHAPHAAKDKPGDLLKAAFGISGLETLLPVTFTTLYKEEGFPLERIVELLSATPARLLGVTLKAGNEITVDLETEKAVNRNAFASMGKNTPFHGMKLIGWPA